MKYDVVILLVIACCKVSLKKNTENAASYKTRLQKIWLLLEKKKILLIVRAHELRVFGHNWLIFFFN